MATMLTLAIEPHLKGVLRMVVFSLARSEHRVRTEEQGCFGDAYLSPR